MKRKVQAQRKFAQGASIPPAVTINTNTSADRRSDPAPQREPPEQRSNNVFHNSISAKSLLDFVCFKNVHTHKEPVVLLERLRHTPAAARETHVRKIIHKPVPITKRLLKSKAFARKYNMRLRSCMKATGAIKTIHNKNAKVRNKFNTNMRKNMRRVSFSLDDDQPLTFFTKKVHLQERPRVNSASLPTPGPSKKTLYADSPATKNTKSCEANDAKTKTQDPKNSPGNNLQLVKILMKAPYVIVPLVDNDGHKSNLEISQSIGPLQDDKVTPLKDKVLTPNNKVTSPYVKVTPPKDKATSPNNKVTTTNDKTTANNNKVKLLNKVTSPIEKNNKVTTSNVIDSPPNNKVTPVKDKVATPIRCETLSKKNKVQTVSSPQNEPSNKMRRFVDPTRFSGPASIKAKLGLLISEDQVTPVVDTATDNRKRKRATESPEGSSKTENQHNFRNLENLDTIRLTSSNASNTNRPDKGTELNSSVKNSILNPPTVTQNKNTQDNLEKGKGSEGIGKQDSVENKIPLRSNDPKVEKCENSGGAKLIDAPVFHPTKEEFQDPIEYFNKIMPEASKFGLCKVVAPKGFKPKCTLNNDMRFSVTNQYICRLFSRWGPASREMCAIKAYLATQSVHFLRPPLFEGIEVNLPKLYQLVQRLGGLKEVIEKKRWAKVAEEMRLPRTPKADRKIDQIYVKYILPYDTLSDPERLEIMREVDKHWDMRNQKLLERASNPLHRQKRLLGESDTSDEDSEEDPDVSGALSEAEDCFVNGRVMALGTFKKVGKKIMDTYFSSHKTVVDVETCYWNLVLLAKDHLCVNTASIDTGNEGYGFTKNQRDPYGKHSWNLKMISQNKGNVLRCLGPVLGVTVPTLHLDMVFSTSCWHRDPHGLPWIEYMHSGPGKVWYGIANSESGNFRRAAKTLCPASCQNKSIWLPSDIAMIPPRLLLDKGVSSSRLVQRPGEFVFVFPKSYSCHIATGYTESESVYFATEAWLESALQVFNELRESCEPTMFPLEKLLLAAAQDATVPMDQLKHVQTALKAIIDTELDARENIAAYNVQTEYLRPHCRQRPSRAWNIREQEECEICRTTLYLSRVRGLIEKHSVCLQHALQLLKARKRRRNYPAVQIEIFFKESELRDIFASVEARLKKYKVQCDKQARRNV